MWEKSFAAIVLVLTCLLMFIYLLEQDENVQTVASAVYDEKIVAITFDDGPHGTYTKMLLDGLKERGVRATFFVVGENIPGNEELILRMHNEGHVIGNHTYTHADLTKISEKAALLEISKTSDLIEQITGEKVQYIRPTCGNWKEELLFEVDLTPVFWNVDPLDWCTYDVNVVVERVMAGVSDGSVILFHDIFDTSVAAALEVIDRLSAQGYLFVTVDEILIS